MHVWRKGVMHTGFGGENLEEEPLGRPRHRWRIILKWIFRK